MRTEIQLNHPLADIRIKALKCDQSRLMALIRETLDTHLMESSIDSSVFQEKVEKKFGKHYKTPGYYVRLYRNRSDLTQARLANQLEIKQHHISEIENNKRAIGKVLAKKLGQLLQCDYRKFL